MLLLDKKLNPHHHLGKVMKEYRERAGLKRVEFSKKLGFSTQFYGRIEYGEIGMPRNYFKKVIKILKVPKGTLEEALVNDFRMTVRKSLRST